MHMPEKKDNIWYDSTEIDKLDATYNLIYGQRSNGKTFRICRKIVDAWLDEGLPSAVIRRLAEMIKAANISKLFDPHLDYIKEKTAGEYNSIIYRQRAFYLANYDGDILIKKQKDPFARCYSINAAETTKGQDAGQVKYVLFDEFITRGFYLTNEFVLYQNLLSSILRTRGAKIYMIANTVSKYCPYFQEMGLTRIKDQKQDTIDVYVMGKTQTKIAVEYCGKSVASLSMQSYYCFDNPELDMITTGSWEIALYRHIPKEAGQIPPDLTFFIAFDQQLLMGVLRIYKDFPILCFTKKTTPIKDPEESIIYSDTINDPNPLHQSELSYNGTAAHRVILDLIKQHKTYFGTNEDGELFANYLKKATEGGLEV